MPPEHKLLLTKLYKPRALESWVTRPRLLQALDGGLSRKLILVNAPAGYGKTTLLTQWLGAQSVPAAWLSLDAADNDISIFLSYFAQAIRTIYPEAMQLTATLLSAVQLPPIDVLTTTVINELDALPNEIILVLDDYHIIHSQAIVQLMSRLVQHPPASLHLVLTTRMDPALPLATLRARSDIAEIRTADLRFSSAEARSFFASETPDALSAGESQLLQDRTEGWPAALRLAALSLKTADDPHAFINVFAADGSAHVTGFLIHEVLGNLSERTQDFLLRMSLLDRFCAPLCDAMQDADSADHDTADARALLNEIARQNLFLIPLDGAGEWFRFHHLFRDLLRSQLRARCTRDAIAGLRCRACDWLTRNGWHEEALQQALEADDMERVAQIIENNVHGILNREEWMTLSRWLAHVPPALLQQRPGLLLAQVYVKFLRNERADIPPLLEMVEQALQKNHATRSPAEIDVLQSEVSVMRFQTAVSAGLRTSNVATSTFEEALQRLPATHCYMRGQAIVGLALILQMQGQKREAEARLNVALAQAPQPDGYSLRILFAQWLLKWFAAEIGEAEMVTERYLVAAEEAGLIVSLCWAHTFAGVRHHELNELNKAVAHFEWVAARAHQCNYLTQVIARAHLTLTHQAMGQPDLADAVLNDLRMHAKATQFFSDWKLFDSIAARLHLLRGDVAGAMRWAQLIASPGNPESFSVPELPTLTRAQALIAQHAPETLAEALTLLHELRRVSDAQHYHFLSIRIMAAQASALWLLNRREESLQLMAKATDMGRRGGLVRSFADLGADVLTVLRALSTRVANDSARRDYVSHLIAAFGSAAAPIPSPAESTGLTQREIEVLELLSRNRSDKEIADFLVISRPTVSRHTANIYRKLGVGNRREAVAKARSLGVIAQTQ